MRSRTAPDQKCDHLGRRLCRVPACLKPVPKGRLSYCSRECATAFEIAYFPSRTRMHVFARDHGVCALCGCDTERLRHVLRKAEMWAAAAAAREMGFNSGWYTRGALWQADHIIECVRGGWGSGLDNLRTLCTPCHKAETARLARERAVERRLSRVAPLFSPSPGTAPAPAGAEGGGAC